MVGVFLFSFFSLMHFIKKFLCATSNKGFLEFSTTKTTKQNKEYVWILWSSWIVICLSWRSEIVKKNLIAVVFLLLLMTMFSSTVVPKLVCNQLTWCMLFQQDLWSAWGIVSKKKFLRTGDKVEQIKKEISSILH